jgi:hypothetical protein
MKYIGFHKISLKQIFIFDQKEVGAFEENEFDEEEEQVAQEAE